MRWLGDQGFLRIERRQGRPTTMFLLNEDGTAEAYRSPGQVLEDLMARVPARDEAVKRHLYLQLPAAG